MLPSAKLTWIDWDLLFAAAGNTLEVLDLSGNKLLENTFPPKNVSFSKLKILNLHGTNLGSLAESSILDMCKGTVGDNRGGGQVLLQSLDLSTDILPKAILSVSGACPHSKDVNGDYIYQGIRNDGTAYYKKGFGIRDDAMYLYYGKAFSVGVETIGHGAQWIFDNVKPSMDPAVQYPFTPDGLVACLALPGKFGWVPGDCVYAALSNSTIVQERAIWKMDCGKAVEPNCRCTGHVDARTGGGMCNQLMAGVPFCFTYPGMCPDGVPSSEPWNRKYEKSHLACAANGHRNVDWDNVNLTITHAHELTPSNPIMSNTNLNLTGFTNLAAFLWFNKSTCPAGFYSTIGTINTPSNQHDVLCGKCPVGTEKLGQGGTLKDCLQCSTLGKFDFDHDASTECEASKFRVDGFEHYIPSKDETRYAFSKSANDPINNDPLRTPGNVGPQSLYFDPRNVVINTINSYQSMYENVPVLLPPINLTKVRGATGKNISFTIDDAPDTFFINPGTGAISANPSSEHGDNFTAKIFAIDGKGGPRAEVETIRFIVLPEDTSIPTNGPGGIDCAHGIRFDGTRFDSNFTCNCDNTDFEDPNCSSSVSEKEKRKIIEIIVACIVVAVALGSIAYISRQRYVENIDAIAALAQAQQAFGLQIEPNKPEKVQGISINSGDLVGVTTNPAFVGITSQFSDSDSESIPDTDPLLGNNYAAVVQTQHNQLLQQGPSKFVAPIIRLGKNTLAAKGLDVLLGVDPKTYMHVKNKVKVILKEFAKRGTSEDKRNCSGLMNGTYVNPPNKDGTPLTAQEIQGQSRTIDELMAYPDVQDAGIERHHVLALRLYTTSTYKSINDPMRQDPPVLPHPFAATLYYISDALSKLREVQGKDPMRRNSSLVFWRGMKNLQIAEEFVQTGGTEMACMSTTSSQGVAQEFAESESPLLFKFVSKSFMSHGADISFLSVYPGEKEVLYPPLTFMRPIKLSQESFGGKMYQVAEVEPVFPK